MITVALADVHAYCVLRALRFKREHMLMERDNMLLALEKMDGTPESKLPAVQAIEVLNAELELLDTVIHTIWELVAAYASRLRTDLIGKDPDKS